MNFDETSAPLPLSSPEPSLPELWILEGGLEALLLNFPALPDDETTEPVAQLPVTTGLRRLQ
jgi:hypothetical protein